MLMYLFILNFLFSIIFMFMNHPLSLGCVLLTQTVIISLASGFFYFNFWFSYILFLIMIGGMLIMFIYMTSVASNEKFSLPKFMKMLFMIIICLMMINIILMDKFYSYFINLLNINLSQSLMNLVNISLNKFFNLPNMQMMIFLMIYLLITLIAVVKITGKNFGTLRQK